MADPFAVEVIDSLTYVVRGRVALSLASADELGLAIKRCYGIENAGAAFFPVESTMPAELLSGVEVPSLDSREEESQASENDAPINHLVQSIIAEGIERRASDIHLEPRAESFRVRYRIDGVLSEGSAPPKRLQLAIISRLKIMANISIAEKRLPQDGRIQVAVDGRMLDLRVSSMPTSHGESVVMRILDQEGLKLGLPELGLLPDDQREFE